MPTVAQTDQASPLPFDTADVVIVGCGPVGATLANLFGLQGISTLVLDREPAVYNLPRAVHFDDEIMRVFQTVGLAEDIKACVHVSPGMRFVGEAGQVLLEWPRPQEIGPSGWHASYRFHQPDLERILRDGLARWSSVSLRTECDVYALDDCDDHIAVRFEERSSGRLRSCRARFVVGCDGARSLVRRLIGSGMQDLGFHERWLVVDVRLKRPRPDLGDWSVQHCDAARPSTYVRGTGDRRRWEISVRPDETEAQITQPARVLQLLQRWVGPDDVELERVALYTFRSAIADRWRRGRLVIAGDAAHLTPPFLGQGMCAGLRDVANVAWKIGAVLKGHASDTLLDSYQTERAPHVRKYIDLAVALGGLINTKGQGLDAASIAETSAGPGLMTSIQPSLGPGLAGGHTDWRGRLAPQPTLRNGRLLDDEVGYDAVAVVRPGIETALREKLRDRQAGEPLRIVADDGCVPWLDEMGTDAAVIRPDRYILGTARDLDEAVDLLSAAAALYSPCVPSTPGDCNTERQLASRGAR